MKLQVALCEGKDCRKHKKMFNRLRKNLSSVDGFRAVRCQSICSGPVVLVYQNKKKYVFRKMREKKLVEELCQQIIREAKIDRKKMSKHLKKLLKVKK